MYYDWVRLLSILWSLSDHLKPEASEVCFLMLYYDVAFMEQPLMSESLISQLGYICEFWTAQGCPGVHWVNTTAAKKATLLKQAWALC